MMKIKEINVYQIELEGGRWERELDKKKMAQLATSMTIHGLLHPIIVRVEDGRNKLVAGEHRLRAAREIGWDTIPAHVVKADEIKAKILSIEENIRRAEVSEVERAWCLKELKDLYKADNPESGRGGDRKSAGAKIKERPPSFDKIAAEKTGLKPSTVNMDIKRVEKTTPKAQKAWAAGEVSGTVIDVIATVPEEYQDDLVDFAKGSTRDEVRQEATNIKMRERAKVEYGEQETPEEKAIRLGDAYAKKFKGRCSAFVMDARTFLSEMRRHQIESLGGSSTMVLSIHIADILAEIDKIREYFSGQEVEVGAPQRKVKTISA